MGLKQKGSRLIRVGSESYRWTLSRSAQAVSGLVSVIIESAEQRGQRLVVQTPCRDFWLDFGDKRDNPPAPPQEPYRPVTPAMVQQIILEALAAGWMPQQRRKNLHYEWSGEGSLIPSDKRNVAESQMEEVFKEGSSAHDTDDFAKAAVKLMPLADDGHAGSQYLVGDMYRWGNGVDQNAEKSLHFLKAAADQGHPKAAFDLFLLLNPGGRSAPEAMQSLPKDAEASKRYLDVAVIRFRELADAGDMDSMAYLGLLFHHGWGVELDGAEAIRWYTKAFDAGGCGAANNLSLVYYEGDIRVRDRAKAHFWYMKAKELDCQSVGIQEFELPPSSPDPTG